MLTVGELVLHIGTEPPPDLKSCPDCNGECLRKCGDGWFHCLVCGISY